MLFAIIAVLTVLALGGAGLVFAGGAREQQQKRMAAVAKPSAQLRGGQGADVNPLKRKNVQQLLQQIESKNAEQKQKLTMRRRLDQAGLPDVSVNVFWMVCGGLALFAGGICFIMGQSILVEEAKGLTQVKGWPIQRNGPRRAHLRASRQGPLDGAPPDTGMTQVATYIGDLTWKGEVTDAQSRGKTK